MRARSALTPRVADPHAPTPLRPYPSSGSDQVNTSRSQVTHDRVHAADRARPILVAAAVLRGAVWCSEQQRCRVEDERVRWTRCPGGDPGVPSRRTFRRKGWQLSAFTRPQTPTSATRSRAGRSRGGHSDRSRSAVSSTVVIPTDPVGRPVVHHDPPRGELGPAAPVPTPAAAGPPAHHGPAAGPRAPNEEFSLSSRGRRRRCSPVCRSG